MNHRELVKQVAAVANLTEDNASAVVKAVTGAVAEALAKGDEVRVHGFGTFSVSERAARTGRNPQTGETIDIPASKVVRFKSAKGLKDLVN